MYDQLVTFKVPSLWDLLIEQNLFDIGVSLVRSLGKIQNLGFFFMRIFLNLMTNQCFLLSVDIRFSMDQIWQISWKRPASPGLREDLQKRLYREPKWGPTGQSSAGPGESGLLESPLLAKQEKAPNSPGLN